MILILGGTTEGRIAVRTLEEAGKPFYYSTKGDEQEVIMHHGIRLQGAMDELDMERFCRKQSIALIVDAAHPFAEQLHRTVEAVSMKLTLPVIRFERIYPPRDEKNITWCHNFDDAIRQIREQEIFILLALTGVQSIAKLKPLWQENACCYFRILDRESSRRLAAREGFPEEHLHYYHDGEDERHLIQKLHPEAILIKESGRSGGFSEKVEAALAEGIRIFAICRPNMPNSFIPIEGEHGLRRMVEKLLPDFYPLRSGLTTGTCAAAAAIAGGPSACAFGCLGYGDCTRACQFDAIHVVNGSAVVDREKCTGCSACVAACPHHVISLKPMAPQPAVLCSNKDKGPAVMKACKAGCIACGMCVRNCPQQAVTLVNNVAVIDYAKCSSCGTCVTKCPKKVIHWVDGQPAVAGEPA